MAPFLPAFALALLAAWCGALLGGATAAGSAAALALTLGTLLVMGAPAPWRDPLRLGWAGRLLPTALWLAAAASWWASPVRRAGTVGLLLLPAFLLLPAAVARCWRGEAARRTGLRALAGVVAGVALWALADMLLRGTPRAAMPLGHHTLLAAFLVALLPVAALPARERGAWRLLGIAAAVVGVAAVLASRSLLGIAGLGVEGVLALVALTSLTARRRSIAGALALLVVAGGLTLLLVGPRLEKIASGEDSSARARAVYFAAGWRGFLERPALGWGPGAAAWTNALHLVPEPGVNPPGEAVGELHSLPLQIAYELGLPGLLLSVGLAALFMGRRIADLRRAPDPALLAAALLGLAGASVAALGTAALAVAALPWAAAVAAGAALAGIEREAGSSPPSQPPPAQGGGTWPVRAYAVTAALALIPWTLAHFWYDGALAQELAGHRDQAVADLGRAVRLDPRFPLYRMRLALLSRAPDQALLAARDGRGVAVLWTVAGILGQAEQRPWAGAALSAACSCDPLDPFPPFFQMQADPEPARAGERGAHALLAEPRLAAAVFWTGRGRLLAESLEEVRTWEGVDAGWKQALISAASASSAPPSGDAGREWLALTFDTDPAESISVLLFRRRPWPTQWGVVPLRRGLLAGLDLPPATTLPTSAATAFLPSICVTTPSQGSHRAVTWHPPAQRLSGGHRRREISTTSVENSVGKPLDQGRKMR
jgi:O-antigen ligase